MEGVSQERQPPTVQSNRANRRLLFVVLVAVAVFFLYNFIANTYNQVTGFDPTPPDLASAQDFAVAMESGDFDRARELWVYQGFGLENLETTTDLTACHGVQRQSIDPDNPYSPYPVFAWRYAKNCVYDPNTGNYFGAVKITVQEENGRFLANDIDAIR